MGVNGKGVGFMRTIDGQLVYRARSVSVRRLKYHRTKNRMRGSLILVMLVTLCTSAIVSVVVRGGGVGVGHADVNASKKNALR